MSATKLGLTKSRREVSTELSFWISYVRCVYVCPQPRASRHMRPLITRTRDRCSNAPALSRRLLSLSFYSYSQTSVVRPWEGLKIWRCAHAHTSGKVAGPRDCNCIPSRLRNVLPADRVVINNFLADGVRPRANTILIHHTSFYLYRTVERRL